MKNNINTSYVTNIKDVKKIYQLENSKCEKINDNKGKELNIINYLIKIIETLPTYDEEQKLIQNYDKKVITILECKEGNYVTASQFFSNQFSDLINRFGDDLLNDNLVIKIIERDVKNSKHKALGLELV